MGQRFSAYAVIQRFQIANIKRPWPNGRFPAARLRTLDPKETVSARESGRPKLSLTSQIEAAVRHYSPQIA